MNYLYYNNMFYNSTPKSDSRDSIVLTTYKTAIGLSIKAEPVKGGDGVNYRMFSNDFYFTGNNVLIDIADQTPYQFYLLTNVTEQDVIMFTLLGYPLIKLSDDAHISEKVEIEDMGYNHYFYKNISYLSVRETLRGS